MNVQVYDGDGNDPRDRPDARHEVSFLGSCFARITLEPHMSPRYCIVYFGLNAAAELSRRIHAVGLPAEMRIRVMCSTRASAGDTTTLTGRVISCRSQVSANGQPLVVLDFEDPAIIDGATE